jgi:deoxyribose-phosphate aldolase
MTFIENKIFSLVDLTLLRQDAGAIDIANLVQNAINNNVAAICVYPEHIPLIPVSFKKLKATVANFPSGDLPNHEVISQINHTINILHVDEIDYVFPYKQYLNQNENTAFTLCKEAFEICKKFNTKFKVIIETGEIKSSDKIYAISRALIDLGVDFIKTSTGKTATGATVESAFAILKAIFDSKSCCGIKVSGGIKTINTASEYINLAEKLMNKEATPDWFRIGTSGLADT